MEKKQSSIDWLIEQLEEKGRAWENVSIGRLNISIVVSDYMELKHQAKAMHKEEIEDAYDMGYLDYQNLTYDSAQEYYTKTFGGNNG